MRKLNMAPMMEIADFGTTSTFEADKLMKIIWDIP
jgi:hypothetical protein